MKVESNVRPEKQFEIENIVGDTCDVVFYDNIEEYEIETEGTIKTNYRYDLYRIVGIHYREDLETELNNDPIKLQAWKEKAVKIEYDALADEVRAKRDKLLSDSDWTQMIDTSLSKEMKDKYARYRQALRDIPQQETFPYDVTWPTVEEA